MKKIIRIAFFSFLLVIGVWKLQPEEVSAQATKVIDLPVGCSVEDIQSILDSNNGNKEHLILHIPAGEYIVRRTIFMHSNMTIRADKNAIFRLSKEEGYKSLIGSYNFSEDKGGYDHIENVTIEGGVWDGNQIGGEYIRFIHANNIKISGVTVKNGGNGAHLITLAGVKNAVIENSVLSDYTGKDEKEAIHLDIVNNKNMVPGTDCYDDTTNQNITIRNNTIKNYPRAVGSHSAVEGVFQKNIVISNNRFSNMSEEAVKLYGFVDTKVTGNKILGAKIGVRVYTYLEGLKYVKALPTTKKEIMPANYKIVIANNTITNSKKYAIQAYASKKYPLQGVTISNNKITTTKDTAIMIWDYCRKNIIKQNTITKAGHHGIGIYKECNSNQILKNKIVSAKTYGIYVGEAKATQVKANDVRKSGKKEIVVSSKDSKTVVTGNK